MFLIVGLGNIGAAYKKTRHNFGFMAVDKIIEQYQFDPLFSSSNNSSKMIGNRFKSDIYIGNIANIKIMTIKPQTYMNLSGEAVAMVMNFYKINIENIIIIHDDIDIPLGKVKTKIGGGNAGHNGLRSIDDIISKNYARIRLGIGRPNNVERPNLSVADYVLGDFYNQEMVIVNNVLDHIIRNAEIAFNNHNNYKSDLELLKNFNL